MNVILKDFEITIPAGGYKRVDFYSNILSILENSAADEISVGIGDMSPVALRAGIQIILPQDKPYKHILFYNTAAESTTVKFILSKEEVRDNRLTITGSVFSTIQDNTAPAGTVSTPASLSVSVQTSIAANASRKELIIQNNGTAAIRYGDEDTAVDRGLRLEAGKQVVLTTIAQVYLIAETGTQTVDYMELA